MTTTIEHHTDTHIEPINLRPLAWLVTNAAGSGLASAGVLIVGVAYGIDPSVFAAGLALVLVLVALSTGWAAWGHRAALLEQIDGGQR